MILPSVSEKTKLMSLLTEFVEWRSLDDPSDPFQMYRSVSYGGLSLYLKAESAPGQATNRRFYPLDLRRSLKTNLQDTVIVEHPIIYVVFKTDEHLFRDEADDIHVPIKEKAADSETSTDSVGLGEVMSQTEDMQSDPEAYKKYFDFYLKYYTTKYAKHGVAPEDSLPAKQPPPGLERAVSRIAEAVPVIREPNEDDIEQYILHKKKALMTKRKETYRYWYHQHSRKLNKLFFQF